MKHLVITAILAVFAVQTGAQEQNPQMVRLAKAIGIYEQIDEQKEALTTQTTDLGQQYIEQILAAVPEAPAGLKEDLDGAFGKMSASIGGLIDTDQVAGTYMSLMEKELSAREIKKVTKFYESPVGKKFTDANTRVMVDWTKDFSESINERAGGVIETYIADLKQIVGRYQPPAPPPAAGR
jgi:ABC-type transporter MlaC component